MLVTTRTKIIFSNYKKDSTCEAGIFILIQNGNHNQIIHMTTARLILFFIISTAILCRSVSAYGSGYGSKSSYYGSSDDSSYDSRNSSNLYRCHICNEKCSSGYTFLPKYSLCAPCQPPNQGCKTCDTSNTTLCASCDDGYYYNYITKKCSNCSEECLTCTSEFICTSCRAGWVFDSDTQRCINPARSNYQHSQGCTEIKNGRCISCENGYILNEGACINTCKVSNCDSCTDPYTYSCERCQAGYYFNVTYGTCMECSNPNCAKCNQYFCLECENGFGLSDAGDCYSCKENCAKCSSYRWSCEQCQDGYGYDFITRECVPCPLGCTSCSIGRFNSTSNTCVSTEPPKQEKKEKKECNSLYCF